MKITVNKLDSTSVERTICNGIFSEPIIKSHASIEAAFSYTQTQLSLGKSVDFEMIEDNYEVSLENGGNKIIFKAILQSDNIALGDPIPKLVDVTAETILKKLRLGHFEFGFELKKSNNSGDMIQCYANHLNEALDECAKLKIQESQQNYNIYNSIYTEAKNYGSFDPDHCEDSCFELISLSCQLLIGMYDTNNIYHEYLKPYNQKSFGWTFLSGVADSVSLDHLES